MKRSTARRLSLALAGALLLHGAAALLLARFGGWRAQRGRGAIVSLELRSVPKAAPDAPAPAPAPPVAAPSAPEATANLERRAERESRAATRRGATAASLPASGAAGPASVPPAPAAGTAEWKRAEGLASGPAPAWAPGWGLSRSLRDPGATLGGPPALAGGGGSGDGPVRVPTREEALAEEQTRVQARLDSWIAQDQARARAEEPHDGYWSDLRGELARGFSVPWEVRDGELPPSVARAAVGEAVDEYLREADAWGRTGSAVPPGSRGSGTRAPLAEELTRVPAEERGLRGTVLERPLPAVTLETVGQLMASGHARFPTRLVVRILLTQRPDGALESAEVATSSGNPIYDRLALAQAHGLGRARLLGPPPAQHRRSLWAFETDFVQLPPVPAAGCGLDGLVPRDCFYPFQKRLQSAVRLEAIY